MSSVVITGIGILSPLGCSAEETFKAYNSKQTPHLDLIPEFAETSLNKIRVAYAKEVDVRERLGSRKMLKFMSDSAKMGCVAAREALNDADVKNRFKPEDTGLYAATGLAAADISEVKPIIESSINESGEFDPELFGQNGLPRTNPLLSFKILANIPPCLVSIQENIKGPNYIFSPWESEGGAAVFEACQAILNGEAECAVVGGSDTPTHPSTLVYLIQSGILKENDIPASAAAYLVIESEDTAIRDNKHIYAELRDLELKNSGDEFRDPISLRIGRTFAASATLNIAMAAMNNTSQAMSLTGVDGQTFSAFIEVRR